MRGILFACAVVCLIASAPHARAAALTAALAPRLTAIAAALAARPTQPKFATAKEVATAFSLRLDRVYELARTRSIPSIHVGERAMRFDVEAVRKALAS